MCLQRKWIVFRIFSMQNDSNFVFPWWQWCIIHHPKLMNNSLLSNKQKMTADIKKGFFHGPKYFVEINGSEQMCFNTSRIHKYLWSPRECFFKETFFKELFTGSSPPEIWALQFAIGGRVQERPFWSHMPLIGSDPDITLRWVGGGQKNKA